MQSHPWLIVRSLFPALAVTATSPALATPPTPPAQIQIANEEALARMQPREGAFRIPIRIVRSEEVSRLAIRVRVLTTDPSNAAEVHSKTYSAPEKGRQSAVEIQIPQQQKDGVYRVELELIGVIGDREGVVDRRVLFQRVSTGRQELLLPEQLRGLEQRLRREAFQNRLKEFPDRPDVRLLASSTIKLPKDLATKIKPISDRLQLLIKATGPAAVVRPHIVERTDRSWRDIDPITIRGQLIYLDFEGTWRPLVNVSVNLYDEDTFGDEHLGTTATDWSGNWSFSVDNDDGWLQNGRDIYYQFHLGNTRWDVHDDSGDDYLWQSAVHDDLSDGAVIDFGTETGSTDATAMQVFGIINLGWNHITVAGGQDPGYIEIQHPTSSTFHSAGVVNVVAGDNDGPDTILHEYGHGLMYRAFGNTSISPGGAHGFGDDSQDPGLAYSEGWATGYMLTLCPDGQYNWHEGATEGSGEWPTCSSQVDFGQEIELFSDGGNRVGERNEGRVAAAINDFRDSSNDNNGGSEDRGRNGEDDANSGHRVSLDTVYRDSMWGFTHTDFIDFWFTFAGNLSGDTRSFSDNIMQYNWMSLPVDISCVASKITASQSEQPEPLLAGLRAFRDQALKPTANGKRWIQSYYSHSPELAMLLIRDAEARKAALGVIEHFSRLGHSFKKRAELERLIDANQPAIPEPVNVQIDTIIKLIEHKGSAELRRDVMALREELNALKGVSLRNLVLRAERDRVAEKDKPLTTLRPRALAPASRNVDWKLIRRYLPKEDSGEATSAQRR